jgi:hypothetical protein
MDNDRSTADRLEGIEGVDDGALGTSPPPETAPPGAAVSGEEHLVPGATFDERRGYDEKPWATSLAFESDQAGVGNDPADAQEPLYPTDDADHTSDDAS